MIGNSLSAAVSAGASLEFLVGLDMRSTEPEALQTLLDLSRKNANVAMYCYGSLSEVGIYHPKLYVSRVGDEVTSIVGSSNLTEGGLKKNVEINVLIEAQVRDEIVSDIYTAYNRLKFHPERVEPNDEFLALYGQLCEREKEQKRKFVGDRSSQKLRRAFRDKAKSLRRPTPTRRDLVGWLEIVYDALPDGEFTNEVIYGFELDFQQQYPDNLNVKAKIRQQLQVLSGMGLIEHLARGRWQKK